MKNDKISVIMSVYNENKTQLQTSIRSILFQSYENLEFIIVNDNPENNVINEVLAQFEDSRIVFLNNEVNMGLVESLNRALSFATGDYIARMDADDESITDRLSKQITMLKNSNYDMVGCSISFMDELGNDIGVIQKFPNGMKKITQLNKWKQCIAHPTWLVKKQVYSRLQGYRKIDYCEDYDFVLRAIYSGFNIGNLDYVGLRYRIRKNSITQRKLIDQKVRSYYLAGLKERIVDISIDEILRYFDSQDYENERKKLISYFENKDILLGKNSSFFFVKGLKIFLNKYFYYACIRRLVR